MLHFYINLFHYKKTIQIFSKIPTFPQNSYLFPTKIEVKAEIPTPSTFSDQCGHPGLGYLNQIGLVSVCAKVWGGVAWGGFQVTTEANPTKLLLQLLWVELS